MGQFTSFTPDINQKMKDAGAIVASGYTQVGGQTKTFNAGAAMFFGQLHLQTTAVKISAGDERYDVIVRGSLTEDFTNHVPLAQLQLGKGGVIDGNVDSPQAAHYVLLFTNERGGTIYPYIRVYHKQAGTAPSANYEGWLD